MNTKMWKHHQKSTSYLQDLTTSNRAILSPLQQSSPLFQEQIKAPPDPLCSLQKPPSTHPNMDKAMEFGASGPFGLATDCYPHSHSQFKGGGIRIFLQIKVKNLWEALKTLIYLDFPSKSKRPFICSLLLIVELLVGASHLSLTPTLHQTTKEHPRAITGKQWRDCLGC